MMDQEKILSFLVKGKIIDENETFNDMVNRVIDSITIIEEKNKWNSFEDSISFNKRLKDYLYKEMFVPSTPILTNSGRHLEKPLTACTVPDVDLKGDLKNIKHKIDHDHQDGMGTGFNLSECDNPCDVLKYLNSIAVEGQKNGKEERPVGNMGILSVYHQDIIDFIRIKSYEHKNNEWKFNISIDCDDNFFEKLNNNQKIALTNGSKISAKKVFREISSAAESSGDPGLVFLNRMNADNPTPQLGEYISTAPCGEVGLAKGETCQFSYINIAKFVTNNQIDTIKLKGVVNDLVRFLDDALELSIEHFTDDSNIEIMSKKRKIGVGICGFSDLLIQNDIVYGSPECIQLISEIMGLVNYYSKLASVELSKNRGEFKALRHKDTKVGKNNFYYKKFANYSSNYLNNNDWLNLENQIYEFGIRNASTIALPPTGRSATVINASYGIEPHFSIILNNDCKSHLKKRLKNEFNYTNSYINNLFSNEVIDTSKLPEELKPIYLNCVEITSKNHLKVALEFQKHVDESISKTINLTGTASILEIEEIYLEGYNSGMKGVTIFKTGSRSYQPRKITQN